MKQFQVMNSPFNQEQTELLNRLLPTLTDSQKVWLGGYLAGFESSLTMEKAETQATAQSVQATEQKISKDITILYGSQTGNSQGLAENAGKTLVEQGFQVTVSSMNDFKPKDLKKIENLLIVVSTHGEGDPPDNAIGLHEFLHGKRAPKLDELRYSVLALGDTSYELFCQTGKDFDKRLEELGANRLYQRVDCDLDFDEPASKWLKGVLEGLKDAQGETNVTDSVQAVDPQAEMVESIYSRTNPYQAEVLENININGRGSSKETRHIELSLENSGLSYKPGDVLGIYPENDPNLVDLILQETKWNPEEKVAINNEGEVLPLREALITHFDITSITKPLVRKAAEISSNEELQQLVSKERDLNLKEYIHGRDLLDLIHDFGPFQAKDIISILRKMPPRLYSIASSIAANPDEVHLTIGAVRYEAHGRVRTGVCSGMCAERLEPGDKISVYIQNNKHFNLPEDPTKPIIMVGPGTGIAPFRSFMQEREEIGVEGKSWLFFGEQHFVTDFLYQTEWQKYLKDGVLTRMDVAFSRDTEAKVYVQHRMLEQSKELFDWLEQGAIFYVCGDKDKMAKDVNDALITIIEKEGSMSREDAEKYLDDMKQNKRYQRDVY